MTKMKDKQEKTVMLIAQELKLARILADNNKTTRDRALKNLKKWILHGSQLMQLTEDDFLRIWKGLFYSMWMSDKLLIQEECAENISGLVHLTSVDLSMEFFKCGLQTLVQEWFGIDQLRLDKFMMLSRRLLRQALIVLKEYKWSTHAVNKFCEAVSKSILDNSSKYSCLGLQMHFIEIYWEEVAKVSEGAVRPEIITRMVKPFIRFLVTAKDNRLMGHVKKFIFVYLMRQSDLGLEYQDKYEAWKQMGFPGSINSVQKIEIPEDEKMSDDDDDDIEENANTSEKVLDPRAGRVDVELAQLKFSSKSIINELQDAKFDPETSTKTRRAISQLIEQFQKMASGVYPFGVKRINEPENDHYDTSIRKAVNRLVKFEKNGLSRKKKSEKKERKRNNIDNNVAEKVASELVRDKENQGGRKRKLINNIDSHLKKQKLNNYIGDPEYVFERNSGTWYVYDTSKAPPNEDTSCVTSPELQKTSESRKNKTSLKKRNPESKSSEESSEFNSPNVENCKNSPSPIKLFESSPQNVKQELFKKNEWDEPLQEGEYEICISSIKGKTRSPLIKPKNKLLINKTVAQLKGKGRLSLDPNLIRDPFTRSPASVKKVKINTKLNKSQEFHEHFSNLLKSPAIPYDASKKPEKPLLKTSTILSPINPFTKQLEL